MALVWILLKAVARSKLLASLLATVRVDLVFDIVSSFFTRCIKSLICSRRRERLAEGIRIRCEWTDASALFGKFFQRMEAEDFVGGVGVVLQVVP